jgi:23S rRNA (cytidine1920-2'-O)/16S rRNA (cytidine1409-2'-O)-methyltransferase
MSTEKVRLDKLILDRGITSSREKARALIMAGQVVVADHVADKAGQQVPVDADIRLKGEQLPYVSRGGLKLAKALDEFGIDVRGLTVLDVGASTGGFTDCLLQRGASKVFAVDVGYGQLAWKLRTDERVLSLEKTNIRHLTPDRLPEIPRMAVIDASFISLDKVLPNTAALIGESGVIIALIKPQFEVGRGEVGKGGVVRDPQKHREVTDAIRLLAEGLGLAVAGVTESPILGPKGNREFLICMMKGTGGEVVAHDNVKEKEAVMNDCLFCKIIEGAIPAKKVFEDERLVVIEDIAPVAPLHLLIIPRKHIVNALDLEPADDELVGHVFRVAARIAREKGVAESGFRIVANNNAGAGQSVFHLHFHVIAGRRMEWPPG